MAAQHDPPAPVTHGAARQSRAAELWSQGRHDDAIAIFAEVQASDPTNPDLALRLGQALLQRGRLADAARVLEPAAAVADHDHPIHDWLGRALAFGQWHERGLEALPELRRQLAENPDDPQRHGLLAVALLSCGRLDEAWPHYAHRWALMPPGQRSPAAPLSRPAPEAWHGRRVLLFAEQGLGDAIQFLRYVPMAMRYAAEVTVEVFEPLRRIAATLPGSPRIIVPGERAPTFDVAVPLMDLPWAFGTTLATIPASVPYLRADPAAVAVWRRRLAELPGRKVGLVWAGDPRPNDPVAHRVDRRRSVPLAALGPLAGIDGVSFVSLQKGSPAAQAAAPPPGLVLHDVAADLADFADTAALMEALDLVISADTAPLHMAGALARPVWLLDRYDACWRWLRERDDSPWYPTLHRFRQTSPGDWPEVAQRVAVALAGWVRG